MSTFWKIRCAVATRVLDIYALLSPKKASLRRYFKNFEKKLSDENVVTLNDKLMWLKINKYWNNPLVYNCADKYKVREYIRECGCSEILNDLYGVWDRAEDIEWDKLPEQFVLKCNHGSGFNLVVQSKSKLDIKSTTVLLNKWLKTRYGIRSAEQGIYDKIERKIIAEKYIVTMDNNPPKDFKFFCSYGKCQFLFLASDRHDGMTKFDYYYPDWTYIPVQNYFPNNGPIEKPDNLEEMIAYAEKLSAKYPLVRVDFYSEAGKIIFGELTFTHFGCLMPFSPSEWDERLGQLLPSVEEMKKWN